MPRPRQAPRPARLRAVRPNHPIGTLLAHTGRTPALPMAGTGSWRAPPHLISRRPSGRGGGNAGTAPVWPACPWSGDGRSGPEIARDLDRPTSTACTWLSGMRRYGLGARRDRPKPGRPRTASPVAWGRPLPGRRRGRHLGRRGRRGRVGRPEDESARIGCRAGQTVPPAAPLVIWNRACMLLPDA